MVYRWFTCSCGKERQKGIRDDAIMESHFALMELSLCRRCEMDLHRDSNMCPEHISADRSVSACGKGWNHVGRCVAFGEMGNDIEWDPEKFIDPTLDGPSED